MSEEGQDSDRRDSISTDLLDDGVTGDSNIVQDGDESALLDADPSLVDGDISLLDKDENQDATAIDDPVLAVIGIMMHILIMAMN